MQLTQVSPARLCDFSMCDSRKTKFKHCVEDGRGNVNTQDGDCVLKKSTWILLRIHVKLLTTKNNRIQLNKMC